MRILTEEDREALEELDHSPGYVVLIETVRDIIQKALTRLETCKVEELPKLQGQVEAFRIVLRLQQELIAVAPMSGRTP